MEFHEKLQSLAAKEGLKGRKVTRALESFSWNITILKGQADLLQHTKAEVQENMKQIHDAALTGNLTKDIGVRRVHSLPRRGQDDKPFAKRANDQQMREDAGKPSPPQLQ